MIELIGTLVQELSLKTDKNGDDYYHGWIKTEEGVRHAFFFFRPDYDLSMRLVNLRVNQQITLQGYWSKKDTKAFLASGFYFIETNLNNFNLFSNELVDEDWGEKTNEL